VLPPEWRRYAHATSGDIDAFESWLKDRGNGGSAFHYATATWLDERGSHRSSVHLVSEELLRSRRRARIKVSKTDHTNRQLGCKDSPTLPQPVAPVHKSLREQREGRFCGPFSQSAVFLLADVPSACKQRRGVMSLNNHLPEEYSPAVLAGLEAAFNDVWGLLHAHVPRANEEANQELAIALSQTLAALVADGVTDPKQLRRRGLESMALTLR
jgi:hypothetical protein